MKIGIVKMVALAVLTWTVVFQYFAPAMTLSQTAISTLTIGAIVRQLGRSFVGLYVALLMRHAATGSAFLALSV